MSPNVVPSPLRMHIVLLLAVLVAAAVDLIASAAVQELPEGFHACQIDSPDRDECIRSQMERALATFKDGVPRLHIPAIDPMVRNATLYDYKRGTTQFLIQTKATTVYGVSNAQVKEVRSHITEDGMECEFDTFFPYIYLEGAYKGEGRLNALKFNSKGLFNLTFNDLSTTWKLVGHFINRDGNKYLELSSFDLSIFMKDFKFYATGLFPDPELNELAISFVNQYWPFVYQQILPQTKAVWEPMFVKESNAFLDQVPFSKFFYYGDETKKL